MHATLQHSYVMQVYYKAGGVADVAQYEKQLAIIK